MGTIRIGIDEVGRGALAGPLVACALRIVEPKKFPFDCVRDSKLLTPEVREELFNSIQASCEIRFGMASNRMIDRVGIQQANVLGVELALGQFHDALGDVHCDFISAFLRYACFGYSISFHINGESKFPEIAAASIAAKVFRDRLMRELHEDYPKYNFFQNKRYGTREHRLALQKLGRSEVHRRSFGVAVNN